MSMSPHVCLALCGLTCLLAGCGYFKSDEEVMDPDGDGSWHREDCDDERGDVYPGATDLVDESEVDENCDGFDGVDDDHDTYASTASGGPDCDDTDPNVNPHAIEVCDEADNDCDGATDEADAEDVALWYQDLDEDGYGDETATTNACSQPDGFVLVNGDCDDGDANVNPEAAERCDQEDNDCDGAIDEDDAIDADTWYSDADGDGYGDEATTTTACSKPEEYVGEAGDCDDGEAAVNPDSTERCDEVDNDCDGAIDEDDAVDADTWYADADGDGYGDEVATTIACSQPESHSAEAADCDDGDADVNPEVTERCDDVDNDCDGAIDEDDAVDADTWYFDADGDGYGDEAITTTACSEPEEYVGVAGDCDDGEAAVNPDTTEQCDEVDNDCDGTIDEDDSVDAETWYADADGDGYGDEAAISIACSQPVGYLAEAADCDDGDADVNPEVSERCDEVDDDCDGAIDEDDAVDAETWYADADDDGFGEEATITTACSQPEGYLAEAADCDDGDDTVYPGADEVCDDGVVNDCDGDEVTAREACGVGGTLSLSAAAVKFTGQADDDYAGKSVSSAGDVDGDGLDDVLIAAYHADVAGWKAYSQSGATYLLLGGGALEAASGSIGLSSSDLTLAGESVDANAGFSVSGSKDVDGDGLDDILVGAIWEDGGGSYAGAAYLLLGGSALEGASGTISLSDADLKLNGEEADEVGTSVSMVGDVDGDSLDDLFVGAYSDDATGSYIGSAYLLLSGGALAGTSGTIGPSGADLKLLGEATGDRAGWSVSGAGDVDGDGLEDLLVGANFEDAGGADAGAVYLLSGGGALEGTSGTLSLTGSDLKLTGEAAGDYAGDSVSGAGDVDSDGFDDLLVGAGSQDTGGTQAGAAYLLLGGGALSGASGTLSLSTSDLKLVGEARADHAGESVAGVGDADGDDIGDLLIGAYNEAAGGTSRGAAYLLLGGGALEGASGTLDLSSADMKLTGEAGGDYAGYSVSGGGDVDGDGFADLLVGAVGESSGGSWAGAAYLVLGGGY